MTKRVNFSSDWLILFVVIIASLTTTIIMNLNHVDDGVNKVEGTISADNGDQKINWDRYRTTNVVLDQTLEIKESGIYHLTGNLSDGLINISVGDEGVVKLILDNASITNSNGPAIACYSADDLVIELIGEDTSDYQDGYCIVYRLCVDDYHHYIYPFDGIVLSSKLIKGKLHTVQPIAHKKYKGRRNTCPF